MNFAEWLDKQDHGQDAQRLARKAITELHIETLVPIIAAEVDRLRRVNVREQEAQQMDRFFTAARASKKPIVTAASFPILNMSFAVGDKGSATWGSATIEDHRARIALLRNMVVGIERTITWHRNAVNLLEKNKVRCLNELTVPSKRQFSERMAARAGA